MKTDSPFYTHALEVLKQSELFGQLNESILKEMLASFQRETWKKRSIVMEPEQTVLKFYVIMSGRVKVTRSNPVTGREFTLSLLGPGDGFDVVSLLDSRQHSVSFETLDDFEALCAPINTVHYWIEDHPEFNRAFFPYLGKQVRKYSNLACDLALQNTGIRLAKLFLQNTDIVNPHQRLHLISDLSNEEIANMIGSVRVVVNRYMQNFKKDNIITAQRGRLAVKDLHALAELSGING